MSEQVSPRYGTASEPAEVSGWAVGFTVFAATMMILAGAFQAFAGLVGIFKDTFYRVTPNYLISTDVTTWGWIHLILGVIVLLAGFAVLGGRTWGRVLGVTLAVLSAISNFLFIPYYPLWSLLVIALDVFVIWALTAHGRDVATY
jgi:multisubunit Na+/H+ antiporter MnhG subunit